MFNVLKYTKILEENGFDRDQAEILVGMFMQMIEFNMVSKSDFNLHKSEVRAAFEKMRVAFKADLSALRVELKTDINALRTELKTEINELRTEVKTEINELRTEVKTEINELRTEMYHGFEKLDDKFNKFGLQLTIKLGVMLALSVGLLSTILAIKL